MTQQSRADLSTVASSPQHVMLHGRVRVNIWVGCSYEHSTAQYSTAQCSTVQCSTGADLAPASVLTPHGELRRCSGQRLPTIFHRYKANSATWSTKTFPQ